MLRCKSGGHCVFFQASTSLLSKAADKAKLENDRARFLAPRRTGELIAALPLKHWIYAENGPLDSSERQWRSGWFEDVWGMHSTVSYHYRLWRKNWKNGWVGKMETTTKNPKHMGRSRQVPQKKGHLESPHVRPSPRSMRNRAFGGL